MGEKLLCIMLIKRQINSTTSNGYKRFSSFYSRLTVVPTYYTKKVFLEESSNPILEQI